MNLLEKIFPSLRRSPEIAAAKKQLEAGKEANMRARDRVLESVEALCRDFDILRAEKRQQVVEAAKRRKRQH